MIKIGFAAYSGEPKEEDIKDMKVFIDELHKRCKSFDDIAFLLGGYWGLMREIVDMLMERDALIILFPPLELEDLEYPKEVVVLKLGLSMRMRSVPLVRSSDIFVAVGGEAGSIMEIVTAYTEKKPIYVLSGKGYSTDKIALYSPYLDKRKNTRINIVHDAETLAQLVHKEVEVLRSKST